MNREKLTCVCGGTSGSIERAPETVREPASRSEAKSCCAPAELATCCDSSRKAACCDESGPESCGCR